MRMMNAQQATTPSMLSRASTAVLRGSTEPGSTMMPPNSVEQDVYVAPPRRGSSQTNDEVLVLPHNPMQHVIVLEHGVDFRSKSILHERILCSLSQSMQRLSTKAELLREKYDNCKDLLERLESIAMAELSPEDYEAKKLGAKLLPLIETVNDKYPLQEYQKRINKSITDAIDQQFTNKNLSESGSLPKTLKVFQGLSVRTRLSLLNAEGALEVAEELCAHLQRVKGTEKQKARTNVTKAWAQGRLLLRNANERCVLAFVNWAYHATLHYEDTEHLYDVWALATRLQADALTEECMDRLFHTASSSIHSSLSKGVSLRRLLDISKEQDSPDSKVQSDEVTTVFRHVLMDKNPPPKLSKLVVDAMARGMDSELWAQIQTMVNQDIARQLIGAMIAYREVKVEGNRDADAHVRLEYSHATDGTVSHVSGLLQGSTTTN